MDNISYREIGYCEIPADLANVSLAARSLRNYCQLRGVNETLWPQIELMFCEAMNNAIEHGCNEDPEKRVKAKWTWFDDALEIEIEDPGEFADDNHGKSLPEDPLEETGRGAFLIDSIADDWRHEATEYGHRFVMRKTLHKQSCSIEKMQDMFETLQGMTSELQLSYSKLEAIRGMANVLSNYPIVEKVLQSGIEKIKSIINPELVGVWIANGATLQLAAKDGSDLKNVSLNSNQFIAAAFRETEPSIVEDCQSLLKDDLLRKENASALLCPISYQGDTMGIIALTFSDTDTPFLDTEAKEVGSIFATFFGIALASASTFERSEAQKRSSAQLEIASEIQKSLLPSSFPNNKFCRVTGQCITAMEVGGDYVDTIEIKDYGLLIIIADVMGKGVPAALLATIFRTAVRSRLNFSETPGWLLSQINKQINEELGHLNMFITAQAGFLSYENMTLKLSSAGHCPTLLMRDSQSSTERLSAEGLPLGIDSELIYEEKLVNLQSGDRLLFMTDGLYESENRSGKMLGFEKLIDHLPEFWTDGVDAVPEKALTFVKSFEEGKTATDDKTLLAVEIL